jgi:hypothetical protein
MKKLSKAEISRRAVEIRKTDLGLTEYQHLCPYELARQHGVAVYPLNELVAAGCPEESVGFFTTERPEAWSAALVPSGTGQFIVENTVHLRRRRRSNIAHEMAHLLLEHEFDRILFSTNDKAGGCRNPASKDMEWEAAELGAELLLPLAAARRAATLNKTNEEVAELYDVSVQLAAWRMNATGARIFAQRLADKWARRSTRAR